MSDVIDRLFPESPDENLLGGYTDFTRGQATEYFAGLSEEDRKTLHWYLLQDVGPFETENYLSELATGYDAVDPDRRAIEALESAHGEVNRIERYIQLFLEADGFFPTLSVFYTTSNREDGPVWEPEIGWACIGSLSGEFTLEWYQKLLAEKAARLIPLVRAFLDNPDDVESGLLTTSNQDKSQSLLQ